MLDDTNKHTKTHACTYKQENPHEVAQSKQSEKHCMLLHKGES